MKKLYAFLKILLGADLGLYAGYALCEVLRYRLHPEIYIVYSAPWYTDLLLNGAAAACIAVLLGATILILKKKLDT